MTQECTDVYSVAHLILLPIAVSLQSSLRSDALTQTSGDSLLINFNSVHFIKALLFKKMVEIK